LPPRLCGWLLPFVLLHLAGWLLPSPCGWLLPLVLLHLMAATAAPFLRLAAASHSSALDGWLLHLVLLHLTAAAALSLRLGATPCSAALGGWLLSRSCGWLLPLVLLHLWLAAASRFATLDGCYCCPVLAAGCYSLFSESR